MPTPGSVPSAVSVTTGRPSAPLGAKARRPRSRQAVETGCVFVGEAGRSQAPEGLAALLGQVPSGYLATPMAPRPKSTGGMLAVQVGR